MVRDKDKTEKASAVETIQDHFKNYNKVWLLRNKISIKHLVHVLS